MGVDPNYFTRLIKEIEQTGELPENIDPFIPTLISIAVRDENVKTLEIVLDHLGVPQQTSDHKPLSLKERLSMHQFGV